MKALKVAPAISEAGIRVASSRDVIGHSSVQPWSAGELFPAVIAKIERYAAATRDNEHLPLAARKLGESWELTLDGRSEEYASYDDAAQVARGLLADVALRAKWNEWQNTRYASPRALPNAAVY